MATATAAIESDDACPACIPQPVGEVADARRDR